MAPAAESAPHPDADSTATHWSRRMRTWQVLLLMLASGLWYAPLLLGPSPPFTFDDLPSVVESPNVRSPASLAEALGAPPGSGASGRPLVALSLAMNHLLGGLDPRGYHVFNVAVHLAAALALFAFARSVLALRGLARPDGPAPTLWALALVLPWAAHPLHTMAVVNVVYRNESLAGLFFLATLAAALAGFRARRRTPWFSASVLACFLGAASKEVIVGAPLVVLIFDTLLVSRCPLRALREHPWLYAGLALCWVPLAVFVAHGDRGESVGLDLEGIAPLDYLRTQAGVLPYYLRLILWPHPLVLDYDGWPVARTFGATALPGIAVLAALALSVGLLVRGKLSGALAASAFVVLAPTSTIVPLSGALVGEHRLYLVVAAVLALLGMAGSALLRRAGLGEARRADLLAMLGLAATVALGLRTIARQADYAHELTIWRDTVEERPDNPRAWSSLGVVYAERGELEAARSCYEEALRLSPRYVRALINLGNLHLRQGRLEEAAAVYERAARERDDLAEPHYYAGSTQVALGRAREGIAHLRRALAIGLDPRLVQPCKIELAWALATAREDALRDGAEALRLAREGQPDPPRPRDIDVLAAALAETGRFEAAVSILEPLVEHPGAGRLAGEMAGRLEAYRAGRPWRR